VPLRPFQTPEQVPLPLLFLLVFLPCELVAGRPSLASPALAAGRRRGPAASPRRPHPQAPGPSDHGGQSRSKGGVPLGSVHRGPVDRVHRRGPRACVTAHVSMTSACVSTGNRSPPRGATTVHPPTALAGLQISPPISGNYKYSLPPHKTLAV
jgi:hypothetical protein